MNWDLSKLYQGFDDEAFISDMNQLEADIRQAGEAVAALPAEMDDAAALKALLAEINGIADRSGRLGALVFLTLAADTNCEAALEPRARMLKLENEMEMLMSAFTRWCGANPGLEALCAGDAELKAYLPLVRAAHERVRHLIDPALERDVREMQLSGGKAWCRLRDELFAGLSIKLTIGGTEKELPLPAVRNMAFDADPAVREAAFRAEIAAYPRIETAMAACLNGVKGEAITMARLQNYPSVLDWALDQARMDRDTLNALTAAIQESYPMFRRYFTLKARALGCEKLKCCDLFAPMGGSDKRYTLDEAKALLLETFGEFHAPIAEVMRRAFEENWIDAYPRPGKEGGAFCQGVHARKMSYVLTNFEGSYSDVSTLAHELGHAFHDSMMNDVPALLTDIPMPLAETASTFNELLLSERVRANASAQETLAILESQISDAAQCIVDIMSRFLFESAVVEARKTRTLSARELKEMMLDAQRQTYGDAMDDDMLHPYMWACKPHYYDTLYHFYNFPYAFGMLFGAGLNALRGQMGEAFWPAYEKLLRFSGSGTVREVAASVGIDVADVDFWRGALKQYADKIDALAALLG